MLGDRRANPLLPGQLCALQEAEGVDTAPVQSRSLFLFLVCSMSLSPSLVFRQLGARGLGRTMLGKCFCSSTRPSFSPAPAAARRPQHSLCFWPVDDPLCYFPAFFPLHVFMFCYFSGSLRGRGYEGQPEDASCCCKMATLLQRVYSAYFEGQNTHLGVPNQLQCLLRNKAHSFEHKSASPGPLCDSSHCWAGPSPRCSCSFYPLHSVLYSDVPSSEGQFLSTFTFSLLPCFIS